VAAFWLWVCAGCAASAVCGFSLMRFAVPHMPTFRAVEHGPAPIWSEPAEDTRLSEPVATVATGLREPRAPTVVQRPATVTAHVRSGARRPTSARAETTLERRAAALRMPDPTEAEPQPEKLALWSRQVQAGERVMSIATDGCRVTWDRTCKHGHPTWLVRLGYLERPRPPLKRHTPR
jgi:hypothetical protein